MSAERIDREHEDLLKLYLKEIGRFSLLTKDDEVRLAKRMEAGLAAQLELESRRCTREPPQVQPVDEDELVEASRAEMTRLSDSELRRMSRKGRSAEREFVQANLRLVVSIAKRYQASGLQLVDLIQEGNMGLMHAVEKFDWRKGFKFSTYATWWIRQSITRGIANTGRTIRLPVHAGDLVGRVQRSRAAIELKSSRNASVADIAADIDLSPARVVEALLLSAETVSLSEPLRDDSTTELGDLVEDPSGSSPFDEVAAAMMRTEVLRLLEPLDDRERDIVTLRFGLDCDEPRTLEEVGRHFHLTRERIRQIEARAMAKLRHPSSETGGRDLLIAV